MKKYIKFNLLVLLLAFATLFSCDTASTDVDEIVAPDGSYPKIVGLTRDKTTPIIEGDTITFTLKTTVPIDRSITLTPVIKTSETTLKEHDDFDILSVTIEPWQTEAKVVILTYQDVLPENPGTIGFTLVANAIAEKNLLHPENVFPSAKVTVNNYVSNDLEMDFAWNMTIDGYPTASNIDLDIFVADAEGYDNSDPWATYNNTDYAATGGHPEHLIMDFDTWADGEYILFHDLWYNAFYNYGPADVLVPIKATFTRAGVFSVTVTQDPSQSINAKNTNGATDDDGNYTGEYHNGFIAKVTIANGKYTITDYAGAVKATGRTMSSKRTSRPASINKTK